MWCRLPIDDDHKMPANFETRRERTQIVATHNRYAVPPRGCEVYVVDIPSDVCMPDIYEFMRRAGLIYSMRFMIDFDGRSRGKCYVNYLTLFAAIKAVFLLSDTEIRPGRILKVMTSYDNNKLVMTGIPYYITQNQVVSEVSRIIGCGLNNVQMLNRDGRPTKLCVLEYETHKQAAEAKKKVWSHTTLWGHTIGIHWSIPTHFLEARALHIQNTTRQELFEILKTHCNLKDVAAVDFDTGNSCTVFFSCYRTRTEAYNILRSTYTRNL
ncbi:RNA-binding protein 47-like [Cylas formicarius]|uniref:RNA-binding protein 47-like n=1 Tax=Cylas formicarius TaxID=197179 RepID=UPI0029586CF4|nr:RNA-binding protein 47-like [Cylas formicarius]